MCLVTVTLIHGLGPSGQCFIQALGLCRHPWSWAVYRVSVYKGQVSLWLLTLHLSRMALCPSHTPACVQVVLHQGVGLREH